MKHHKLGVLGLNFILVFKRICVFEKNMFHFLKKAKMLPMSMSETSKNFISHVSVIEMYKSLL